MGFGVCFFSSCFWYVKTIHHMYIHLYVLFATFLDSSKRTQRFTIKMIKPNLQPTIFCCSLLSVLCAFLIYRSHMHICKMSCENGIILSSFWTVSMCFFCFCFEVLATNKTPSITVTQIFSMLRFFYSYTHNSKREWKNERFLWLQSFYVKFTSWTWCHTAVNIFDTFFFCIYFLILVTDWLLRDNPSLWKRNGVQINVRHKFKSLVIFYRHPFQQMNISVWCCCHFRKTVFPLYFDFTLHATTH